MSVQKFTQGTLLQPAFDPDGLANGAEHQSASMDFGALFGIKCEIEVEYDFDVAPTAGNVIRQFLVFSDENVNFPAGLGTGDAAVADDVNTIAAIANWEIDSFVVNDQTTAYRNRFGEIPISARHAVFVAYNVSGTALGTAVMNLDVNPIHLDIT